MQAKLDLCCFLFIIIILLISCATSGKERSRGAWQNTTRESLISNRKQVGVIKTLYGKASYYGEEFHGRKTASGEVYNMNEYTAAHRTLPFGTICRVINLKNQKSVMVRINDRGPFVVDRIIDLSLGAARAIDGIDEGIMNIKIEILEIPE